MEIGMHATTLRGDIRYARCATSLIGELDISLIIVGVVWLDLSGIEAYGCRDSLEHGSRLIEV